MSLSPIAEGDARPSFPTIERYAIRRELGRGAASVVYEALDARDGAVVALKMLDADEATIPEHLYRLKQEFRALADLAHPNIVRFGELASHEGRCFFTMELVHGVSFIDYVRPEPGPSFDEARLRDALAQLVAALTTIHGTGQVHRDIKPSNVLVTEEGRLVVLDFGLMTARSGAGIDEAMNGTPDYMAPEQIEGDGIGPAADWYAVGTMLFQALTGRLPFTGRDAMDLLSTKLTGEAPPPHDVVPAVPDDLDALCTSLLACVPQRRPSAAQIRIALGVTAAAPTTIVPPDPAQAFVGRRGELAALESAFDAAAAKTTLVVVEGEPGIGKSALVHRFLGSLGDRAVVLSGRSYEQESVPFKGIDAVIDSLSQHLLRVSEKEVRRILGGGVRFLATVFPVLNRVPQVAEATRHGRTIENPMALREQAFGEFERLVDALGEGRGLVLFLDDLQWADRDSLALLNRVLGRKEKATCLLVTTIRSGVELPAGATELLAGATRVALDGLTDSESAQLCAELWAGHFSPNDGALIREAAGHPLYLAELVHVAQRGRRPGLASSKLQDVLWHRIQERDLLERRFLEMVALAGVPTPYEIVAEAAGLDVGECQTHLSALRASQLIRVSRRGEERLVVAFHDRVREAILQRRDAAAATKDHLHLGRTLLKRTPKEGLGARVFAIVRHLNLGRTLIEDQRERLELARLNLLAAREAVLATTYDAACGYAQVGLALQGTSGWADDYATTRDLHIERMRAEFLGADEAGARRHFEEAGARITSATDRTELYVTWLELESGRGDFEGALATARARLRELDVSLPRRISFVGVLLQFLATRMAQSGRAPEALTALPVLADGPRASAMRVLMAANPAAYWTSSDLAGWIALKLARMSMRYGVSDVSAAGFATYGVVLVGAFGRHAEAAEFGRLALTLNAKFRNERLDAQLNLLNGEFLAPWVRPYAEAKAYVDASYEWAVKQGDTTWESYAACSLSHLGAIEARDLAAQQRTSEWALDVCTRRRDWNMAGSVLSHQRFFSTLRGETPADFSLGAAADPAFVALVGDARRAPSAHDGHWEFRAALAYLFGENVIAAQCLRETRRLAQAHFGHLTTLDLCFTDCLVSARAHDAASWGARAALRWRLARGVRRLRGWATACPSNFEAHYLIARAELARVRGARDAGVKFEAAVASAQAHGARLREGLALELSAVNAEQEGDRTRAGALRAEAVAAYERCGAMAKAHALAAASQEK